MKKLRSRKLLSSYSQSLNHLLSHVIGLSLPLALAFLTSESAIAYQIPTTANGLWSGTNVTTGLGNTLPATKTTPSGIQVKISVAGSGTTVLARNNTTLMTSGNTLIPPLPGTTNGLQLLTDLSNCPNGATVLTCPSLGSFSIEFLDPTNTPIKVRNPIVHWSRLGGSKSVTTTTTKSFLQTVIIQLNTPNLKFGSVSGSSIAVSPGVNNNIRWAFPATPPATAGVCSTTSSDAGCGSTPILDNGGGNVLADRLDFSVTGQRTNASINWNELVNGALTVAQDGYFVTVSFEEDYGDAPASFDGTAAATHVLTDLALGSLIDAENSTVANGGADGATSVASSPKAVTAGSDNTGTNGDGSDDDGVTSFPPLSTTLSGTTYTVPVALSGASRDGRVCGWIDFNRNGTFDSATERACSNFVSGATTTNLSWTVPAGLTVGNNYVRIRASYDVTGVQNPTGRLSSGEVEDYRIPITAGPQPNQPPTTNDLNSPAQLNPGTNVVVTVPSFAGADPEDGVLGSGKTFEVVTLPTNGTLYYNGIPVTAGQVISNYDPTKLTIDPNDGALTVSFTYAAIDSAGLKDTTPATVTMPFTIAGVNQPPTTTDLNSPSQVNPGTNVTVSVPTLSGVDPEDGVLGSGKTFKITTLPTNGSLSYNGLPVIVGQIISNYDPTKLTIDPNDGALTVSFTYAAIDSAGLEDATPATVTMPFTLPVAGKPNLLLVKRITAINGSNTENPNDTTPLNLFVDDTTSTKAADDNNSLWIPDSLKGAIDGGRVKTGDEVEYTIYFLSAGDAPVKNLNFCDLVPSNTTFLPNGFGVGKGIQLSIGSTLTDLTNVPDADEAEFFAPNAIPPVNCSTSNTNGAVIVKIVNGATGIPNAVAPGTPGESYGFVRFKSRVK